MSTLTYEEFKEQVYELHEGSETSMSDNDLDSAIKRTMVTFSKNLDDLKLAKTLNTYLTEKLKRVKK